MTSNFFYLYKKDISSNPLRGAMVDCLNLLFSLNDGAWQIAFFDKRISKDGICKASLKFLKFLKINIKQVGLRRLRDQDGYLIFGNHPMFLDPLLMITAIGNDEIKFFGSEIVLKAGHNFSRHIFPIRNLQTVNGKRRRQHLWDDWLFSLFLPSLGEYWERKGALIHNRRQVEKAAEFLAGGGKLIIFPFGHSHTPEWKNWRNGIGFVLAKALQKNSGKQIKLLPFFIEVNHPYIFQLKVLSRFRNPSNLNIFFNKEIDPAIFGGLISEPRKLSQRICEVYQNFASKLK